MLGRPFLALRLEGDSRPHLAELPTLRCKEEGVPRRRGSPLGCRPSTEGGGAKEARVTHSTDGGEEGAANTRLGSRWEESGWRELLFFPLSLPRVMCF